MLNNVVQLPYTYVHIQVSFLSHYTSRSLVHGDSADHPYAYLAGAGVREIFMRDQRKFFLEDSSTSGEKNLPLHRGMS